MWVACARGMKLRNGRPRPRSVAVRFLTTPSAATRERPPLTRTERPMVEPAHAPHRVSIAVRWGDMDALGHVNNARFFTYDEDVRLGFFNQLMAKDARFWKDYGLILAHIGCDFVAQVRAPSTLEVCYGIARIGSKSFETREEPDEPPLSPPRPGLLS